MRLDRRRFLAGAGALGATATALPRAAGQPADGETFGWGVASFDPTADSVLLWTRVAPRAGPQEVSWELARDPELDDVVARGRTTVDGDTDHCVVVTVGDLVPGVTWWFRFTAEDGARSMVGRTRTTARATERTRLGVVSCSRYASGGFAAYRALADREVDLVVHLGDYIYEDGAADARPHDPPTTLLTLDEYRRRYAQHRTDPDLQALHARHPMVAVWDDHDLAGNAWRDGAPGHDPATDGPWSDRVRAASQAHEEWLPGRTARGEDGRLRAWRTQPLGDLAELVVLDTRAWGRDPQPRSPDELDGPPEGGVPPGATRSLLGTDQAQFVAQRLVRADDRDARPPWVLLANQVMFHPLRVPIPSPALVEEVEAAGLLVVGDEALNADQWDGYPQARDDLRAAIGRGGGVVMLTGDLHSSWAWEGHGAGDEPTMVELVTPSVSSPPFADRLPLPASLVETGLRGLSSDLSFVELSSHGFLLVDLDAERVQAEWWFVDPAGPAEARLGAARQAPRAVPMRLREVTEPTTDPPTTATSTSAPRGARPESGNGGDGGLSGTAVGAAAAGLAAAIGAALALRRRAGS